MKIRTLLLTFLVMCASVAATAQIESGKVYRIVNKLYGTVAYEGWQDNEIRCAEKGDATAYSQYWIITETATESKYTFQNVFSGRYLKNNNSTYGAWYTVSSESGLYITDNSSEFSGCYTISSTAGGGNWGMHCDGSNSCVPWYTTAEATNWTFEEYTLSAEDIETAHALYQNMRSVYDNADDIAETISGFYEDNACTTLKAEYLAMSDTELTEAMDGLPADLQEMTLKIKNDSWNTEKREKEFRIYSYKPYSDPYTWADILYTRYFNRINNPTGICTSNDMSYMYVFVDEVPEGTTMYLTEVSGTAYNGTDTELKAGCNLVPAAMADGVLYVRYNCETDTAGKKLADYPAVTVHIEGGYVNGFWSKERGHTNEDWAYMQQYMFENESAIQCKGDITLFSFRKKEFLAACPEKITEVMTLWDFWNERQRWYMHLDKYEPWFNNGQLAMSDDSGFMDASNWRTHYNNNTLSTIVNYNNISTDAGSAWGPNHEIGHTNQYAFQIVGTSEVSNNALTNFAIFDVGTHTSRGNDMTNQITDFENKVPYVVRGESEYGSKLFSMTRMYFQLFLYFHAAKKDTTFYPRLFERLRYDRLVGWGTYSAGTTLDANGYYVGSMNAKYDQLKFAEICCELANMDLSEFFEAWGFFIPMKNAYVGDYGNHYVYLLQEDIDESKARMQQYEKKGGHLMFLEDRIRESPRLDGNGYRADYSSEVAVGTVGDFGMWLDYIDESVKAQGYYYTQTNGKIIIKQTDDASGALGFKLYNADTGELLTFTNKTSMTIPATATGANLKVVAAQADGTDYTVQPASEGPEEMQLEAFKASLTKANSIISNTTSKGTEVGKYYADAVQTLQELYTEAKEAYDNLDTSVHSYADWSSLLDEEYNAVVNNDKARMIMKEGCTYYMYCAGATSQYLTWSVTGLAGTKNTTNTGKYDTDENKHWLIEYSGEPGIYYLKCENGYYVSDLSSNGNRIYASAVSPTYAVKFTINYTAEGKTYFSCSDNEALAIGLNSSYEGVGTNPSESKGLWQVRLLEDNSAAFESETLATLLEDAKLILTEVSDTAILAKGDTVTINSNIELIDINLQDYVKDLYEDYSTAVNGMDNAAEYYNYIQDLRESLSAIEGAYAVAYPAVSTDGYFKWYVIRSEITDNVWSLNSSNRIILEDVDTDAATETQMWAILPGENSGEYKLLNASTGTWVYRYVNNKGKEQSNYCVAEAEEMENGPMIITFGYDSENSNTIIYTGAGAAVDNGSATLVQYKEKETSGWIFELVSVEKNDELYDNVTAIENVVVNGDASCSSADTYDLFGRKVLTPVKNNIYIKNGEKFIK